MTVTGVKLSSRLPRGALNGLAGTVAKELAANPATRRLTVAIIDVEEVRENYLAESETVVLRIRRVEMITQADDIRAIQEVVLRAHTERSGQAVLPFENDEQTQKFFDEWAAAPEPGRKDNDVSWDPANVWDGDQSGFEGPPGLRTIDEAGAQAVAADDEPWDEQEPAPEDDADPPGDDAAAQEPGKRKNPLFKDGAKK